MVGLLDGGFRTSMGCNGGEVCGAIDLQDVMWLVWHLGAGGLHLNRSE